MEEDPSPSKNAFRNQNDSLKNKKGVNNLMHVAETYSDADDF
jgi:hypothetical protein